MKLLRLFFIIPILFVCTPVEKVNPTKAENGIIDLANGLQSIGVGISKEDESIKLNGEWEFYWKEFLTSEDFKNPEKKELIAAKRDLIQVPGKWNGFIPKGMTEKITGEGFATYRLLIKGQEKNRLTHLKLLNMNTSYRIYVNGIFLFEAGRVGKEKTDSLPYYFPTIIKIVKSEEFDTEIIMHMSNYFHRDGGTASVIELGSEKDIYSKREKNISLDLFLFGSLSIMSLYHLGLFFIRRKDKSPLYFSIFTLCLAIRPLLVTERYILALFPDVPWSISLKIEYFALFNTVVFATLFFRSVFPKEAIQKISIFFVSCFSFFSIFVLIADPYLSSRVLIVAHIFLIFALIYFLYCIILAGFRNRTGSRFFLIGSLVLIITTINDILFSRGLINTNFMASYGMYIFVFSQAYLLSVRFSNAFKEEEKAKQISESQRIQLETAKSEIEKLSKTKDEFLSNLSHEIKTPLSVVYAYSQMLGTNKDNPTKVEKYSTQIFANAEKLNEYVSNLILVTDIESNLELQKQKTEIIALISEVIGSLNSLREEKSVQIHFPVTKSFEIVCDPILIKKAVSSIIKNAIVYNNQNGTVEISVETDRIDSSSPDKFLQIRIKDTGIGIKKENQERVFEKFFRVDSSLTYEVSGVGIGLFLAKRIIELHNGMIEMNAEVNSGTEVMIELPLINET